MDYRLSVDTPNAPIVSVCFEFREPTVPGQGLGRTDRDFFISDGRWAEGADVAEADVGIRPMLEEPVEEDLGRVLVW